jgi:uncharacterized cupin superfamily protein
MQLQFKKLEIKKIQAPNFIMSPAELKDYIDFEVKRIYFIRKPTGNTSQHCHLKEKELFIMAVGSCIAIIDRGSGKEEIKQQGPTDALYIGNYVWHGFKDFSADAVLLALSSTNYNLNREDYIEDYDQYRKTIASL